MPPHTQLLTTRFGGVLQAARKRAGLTQEQLAGRSGVSIRAIRDLELGRASRPRRETIRLLADALSLTGSHRALLESASGHESVDTTLRQMYEEEVASPPASMGPLIGREREHRVIAQALVTGQERLLALVGLPGVGKSRLALAAAHRFRADTRARVVWLPGAPGSLGGSAHPGSGLDRSLALLTGWITDRLSGRGPLEELAGLIGTGRTLLVIDAYDPCVIDRDLLLRLLSLCDGLQVLATARAPLPRLGARAVPLSPMPLDAGPASPAVELMLSHVTYTRPSLPQTTAVVDAVGTLCRALDGIPLALNLAAGWFALYSPEQLVPTALESPLNLVEPVFTGEPGTSTDLAALIRAEVAGLRGPLATLLYTLASLDDPCPTGQLMRRLGGPSPEANRALRGLLLRGLVREEPAASGDTALSLPNLVRHTLHAATARTTLSAALPALAHS